MVLLASAVAESDQKAETFRCFLGAVAHKMSDADSLLRPFLNVMLVNGLAYDRSELACPDEESFQAIVNFWGFFCLRYIMVVQIQPGTLTEQDGLASDCQKILQAQIGIPKHTYLQKANRGYNVGEFGFANSVSNKEAWQVMNDSFFSVSLDDSEIDENTTFYSEFKKYWVKYLPELKEKYLQQKAFYQQPEHHHLRLILPTACASDDANTRNLGSHLDFRERIPTFFTRVVFSKAQWACQSVVDDGYFSLDDMEMFTHVDYRTEVSAKDDDVDDVLRTFSQELLSQRFNAEQNKKPCRPGCWGTFYSTSRPRSYSDPDADFNADHSFSARFAQFVG